MSIRYFSHRNPRLELLYWLVAGLFIVLVCGLAWRQLFLRGQYQAKEERQNLRRIIQPGPRGLILDRNGNVLAGNRPLFSAVVHLEDPLLRREFDLARIRLKNEIWEAQSDVRTANAASMDWETILWESRRIVLQRYLDQINGILGTEEALHIVDIKGHFWHRLLMPFPLMDNLKPEQYAQLIEQLPLGSPIGIYTDTARDYPNGSLAAHTLGYVVPNPEVPDTGEADLKTFSYVGTIGKNGLELSFDEHLQGRSGQEVCVVDRFQYKYRRVESMCTRPGRGKDLTTSLDLELQRAAETAIGDRAGAAVAIHIPTGEILVMASKPDYNLMDFSPRLKRGAGLDITERGAWVNRALKGVYPPGSTFKMMTAISAMRADVVDPYDQLTCGSFYMIGRRKAREHSGMAFGLVDLPRALEKSSNVYCYQIGIKTGIANIAAEARRFGLHEPTGVELPYESRRMIVPDKAWKREERGYGWTPGDTANVSIGEGDLQVTPLQVAAYIASLARRETRTQVTLLHKPDRAPVDHGGESIGLTDREYNALLEGMERATGPEGTARIVAIPGLRIAAKTGTVQRQGGRTNRAWCAGFAPIDNPQIAFAVIIEGKDASDHLSGGSTSGPIAKTILKEWFEQYGGLRLTVAEPL